MSHLNNDRICLQLEAGLDEDLQAAARDAKAHKENSLHPWIAKIKDLDNRHIIQQKHVAEAVEEAMHSNKKLFTSSSHMANVPSNESRNSNSLASITTFICDYPPKLMEEEHQLLMDHTGCLKCHKFFAGHWAHQCTITISGKNYKMLTLQDAQRTKAAQNTKNSKVRTNVIVSVTDSMSPNQTEDFIAAVFPTLSSGVVGDRSYMDGSDNSFGSVSVTPHIKSKHFIWNCSLTGPSVDFLVMKASLIDNSCHMVLIWSDVVKELGLSIFTLDQPEEVDVAISFSKAGIT